MAFGTTSIDPGSSPSVPVAQDTISSAVFQRIKLADPTEGTSTAIGNDANPLKTKARRAGTSDYDSGRVSVSTPSTASVTTATIYPEGGFISNTSTSVRKVTLTNTADQALAVINVAPEMTIPLPHTAGAGAWVGLKAGADGSGVVLHVAGGQA